MAKLLDYAFDVYNRTMELRDPRTDTWFIVDGPWPTVTILACYLFFCISLGPRLMADKKPMEFPRTMIAYNIAMVLWCVAVMIGGLRNGWWNDYSYRCQPYIYPENSAAHGLIYWVYYAYLMKIFELMDTVFIVLRKDFKRISFLHLYHHGAIPFLWWLYLRFTPGAVHATLGGVVNCFVNAFVYSYYALSALDPKNLNYRWLKPYLTLLQISQFVFVLVHYGQLLFIECDIPKGIIVCLGFNTLLFLVLFIKFYIDTYIEKKSRREFDKATKSTKKSD